MDMVDRILKAFALKRPMTEAQAIAVRDEVTQFAQGLLADYKRSLAARQALIDRKQS